MSETFYTMDDDGDATFTVRIVPNAKKTEVVGLYNGQIKIKVHAAPEKGEANEELIDFLADELNCAKSDIRILSGHISKIKKIQISDANQQYLDWLPD